MGKYTTEQLIGLLENHKVVIEAVAVPDMADKPFKTVMIDFGGEIRDAIIAKLRAGDKLCEAAKSVCPESGWSTLWEAIAEHEGK